MDRVFVQGLELYCVIGVQGWEREVMQRIVVDLEMEADCRAAGDSDRVEDALDYRAVAKAVQLLVEGSGFQLVEALAAAIARLVLQDFPRTLSVRVRVSKPGAVRFSAAVGVEIVRRRQAGDG